MYNAIVLPTHGLARVSQLAHPLNSYTTVLVVRDIPKAYWCNRFVFLWPSGLTSAVQVIMPLIDPMTDFSKHGILVLLQLQ